MGSLASRIKELRTANKMSQQELADILGMKRENISNYERGTITNVPSEVLDKLADHFQVSIDYLLGRTDSLDESAVDEEYADLLMMFRKGEKVVGEAKKEQYKKQVKSLMSYIAQSMNEDENEND
ncbi:helix-turn-helix domain-containing protein [Enterococcus sp. BWT-B8]|uniref:helix-turn-helix domain-containing protein n=1 Tax=unclassified Enterococcus TaxID=2608891 RepID=UPI001E37B538|nr:MULTISPECIES: helix-turn-helix transcriptional regulator [unclassified Enterococcus]MCB5951840.1 helix-turn-helix domain-containing protein [Enterococcus sp. BWT-B8]MCB5954037.1 helix-turn-helix domain-containing protein [Enterococcus sp. CWB-B31]